MLKKATFKIKGMSRDLAATAFNSQYAYENKNVRIMTTTEENTLLSLVNEKGTLKADLDITGFPIGQASLNNEVILFTTSKEFQDTNIVAETETINTINATEAQVNNINDYDRIYKLWVDNNTLKSNLLYEGYLNFSYKNPIETLPIYENNSIKKIYWVDGKNQPRFINIAKTYSNADNTIFDFIKNINLNHVITVEANTQNSGQFNSGVIQYACSYFNIYGQQSNIFYESHLLYAAMNNRGGSPEEKSSNSFNISLSNLDTNFDYVRIYSIFRTSIDSTPTVKVVGDFSTKSVINYTDTNTTGYIIDPTELFYIGGESIVAGTISQKDNTLFLGNIKIERPFIPKEIKDSLKKLNVIFYNQDTPISYNPYGTYAYENQLKYSSKDITSLKYNETYRFGIQFQYKTGKWSEVCYLNDNVVDIPPIISIENDLTNINTVKAQFNIPSEVQTKLTDLGYVKARGVIVYPTESDRSVIAQGVVNPTLFMKNFHKEDELDDISTSYMSSWFFRPFAISSGSSYAFEGNSYATFKDRNVVTGGFSKEIALDFIDESSEAPIVDLNLLTFHSPDIEFSNISLPNNVKFRIIGSIKMSGYIADKLVTTTTPPRKSGGFKTSSYQEVFKPWGSGYIRHRGCMLLSSACYLSDNKDNESTEWLISPWQRSGSLIDDTPSEGAEPISKLDKNKTCNLRYSAETVYNTQFWTPKYGISNVEIFDSNELSIAKINDSSHVFEYLGNNDMVLYSKDTSINYVVWEIPQIPSGGTLPLPTIKSSSIKSNNPVGIKYKSGKHAVFKFLCKYNSSDDRYTERIILPNPYSKDYEYYNKDNYTIPSYYEGDSKTNDDLLWLGELYVDYVANRFGGTSDNVLANNKWVVAGEAINLNQPVQYTQGDTYIQRYDCLKTYPWSQEDVNNVTEILSFFCETRVNIDGRYDRNRGNKNNLVVSPENFNLLNNVYSQTNNFFNPNYVIEEDTKYTEFNNIVTWSKSKTLGEKVDTWTNITLASTLDLDGDKGPVRAIRRFNNNLVAFQDRGISQILYNESVQIASTNGVPIEIGNSGKVTGKRYISDKIGCMNKWSICETPSGLYFIDDITKGIYLFNGQLDNISDKLGFHSWINSRSKDLYVWNPKDFNGFVTYYDKVNGDVFFITKEECLAYSEPLKEFTSFYSYEHTPYFINIQDRGLFFKNTDDNNTSVWLHNEGKYNYYFDTYQPFYTTIIANPEAINDKTFSMVEFRADTWNDKTLLATSFDNLEAWNEYQSTASKLVTKLGVPSNLKRKFRIWRAQIPRDKSNNRDRMRNPWLYIKMGMNNPNENKTLLQDLTVIYF